jgi:hypothetical protein
MEPKTKNKLKFVLVTSDLCMHCSIFKQTILSNLQETIHLKYKNLDWIHINIPTFELQEEKGYPKGLRNLINWFPIILLIPTDLWENDDLTKGFDRIKILNGRIRNGRSEIERKYNINLENIIKWLNEELKNYNFFRNESTRSNNSEEKTIYQPFFSFQQQKKKQKFRERKLINFNS